MTVLARRGTARLVLAGLGPWHQLAALGTQNALTYEGRESTRHPDEPVGPVGPIAPSAPEGRSVRLACAFTITFQGVRVDVEVPQLLRV
jgi:hypothetical protein